MMLAAVAAWSPPGDAMDVAPPSPQNANAYVASAHGLSCVSSAAAMSHSYLLERLLAFRGTLGSEWVQGARSGIAVKRGYVVGVVVG